MQNEQKCVALCDYKSLYSKNINLKKVLFHFILV